MAWQCPNCEIEVEDICCPICGDAKNDDSHDIVLPDASLEQGGKPKLGKSNSFHAEIHDEDFKNEKKDNFSHTVKVFYIPLIGILVDTLQFTFLPWQLLFPFPRSVRKPMNHASDVVFFQFFDIDIGQAYEICQFICCGFVLMFLIVINAPQQKLSVALGNGILSSLWGIIISFQTILFMPISKFSLSSFYCRRYAQVYDWNNPDKDVCWTPRHLGMLVCATVTVFGLYVSILSFIKFQFTQLELIKRRFAKFPFSVKTPKYAILLATVKLVCAAGQVIVREIFEDAPQKRDIILASIMIFALGTFLIFLGAALPYKNQFTTCFVYGLMTASLVSNIIGLFVAVLNNDEDYNFVTMWFVGVPLSAVIAYHSWKFLLVQRIKNKVATAKGSSSLDIADDLQGPLPEVFCELLQLLAQPNKIETVSFAGAFLNSLQVSQLCASMASNKMTNIQTVDLSRNYISGLSHGLDILVAKSDTIKTLILDHNELPTGVPLLATQLAKNKVLIKLSMANCGLEASAGVNLGQALARNKTLQDLNIAQNNLAENGALGLAEGLAQNKTIVTLDVSWNQMGTDGLSAILNTFDRQANINMICNKVPQADLTKLKEQLAGAAAETSGPTIDELFKAVGVTNIYDLIGAVLKLDPKVAMHALCEEFYIRLVTDRRLLPFFANISMGRMRNLQKMCLTEALGGPKVYKGLDLKTGHAHLKICDDVYDATIAHLFGAVLKFIPEPPACVVKELVGLTEALRPLVCNTSIEDGVAYTAEGDPLEQNVKDSKKAAPFFSGTMWSTGCCKSRKANDSEDVHPALAVKDRSKSCCPCMSSQASVKS